VKLEVVDYFYITTVNYLLFCGGKTNSAGCSPTVGRAHAAWCHGTSCFGPRPRLAALRSLEWPLPRRKPFGTGSLGNSGEGQKVQIFRSFFGELNQSLSSHA